MFLLNLPLDLKEHAAIERRRREEKERLSRIFNEKYRTIGIDKLTLDEQIKEREKIKEFERQRNDAFDHEMICNDLKQIFLDEEKLDRKRKDVQELNEYRLLYQRPEDSREWDLNDPNRWKSLKPTRMTDNDLHLGPSSGQIFTGEDLQASVRKKAQQEQLKDYFDQQVMTKLKKDEQEYLANLIYDYKQLELSEQSLRFEQMENECHRAMELATRNYNEILANETKTRENQRKIRETQEKLAEIANMTFSDFFTENSSTILDARDHILLDRWKGMTKDQLADIRQQQLLQINDRQKKNSDEKYFDDIWATYANAKAKQELLIEQQKQENKRQLNYQLKDQNRNLAKIQHEQQEYLNSVVYRSIPTAAFYQQFNTTSR